MSKINYDLQVYCAHCGENRIKLQCRLLSNWGYKCPECGRKCRTKPKDSNYIYSTKTKKPIYPKHHITTEIKQLAKAATRME